MGIRRYVHTDQERLVVSGAIMDFYSRRIVGWSLGEKNSTELVEDAFNMAAVHRRDFQGVLLHSDQGVQ